jgi:hypothetical protein
MAFILHPSTEQVASDAAAVLCVIPLGYVEKWVEDATAASPTARAMRREGVFECTENTTLDITYVTYSMR